MSDRIEIERDVLRAVVEILEIASDWNAPSHYEIKPPKGWGKEVFDKDSDEPKWVALYLFTPKLRELLNPPKAATP